MKKIIPFKQLASLPVYTKTRNDYADYDYIKILSPKELNWLKGFHREFVDCSFNHSYSKHHKSKKLKRDCYNRNNVRNRDLYTICKAVGTLSLGCDFPEAPVYDIERNHEDILISLLDCFKDKDNLSFKNKNKPFM